MDDKARIHQHHSQLCSWLCDAAYPLWSTRGVDPNGGYFERLGQDGKPFAEPRRSRVTPRQAYCFAMGPSLGWKGDAAGLVKHGLDFWFAKFQRPDGLFRTLINADGSIADDRAITYDQAFGLLAFNLGATLGDWRAVRERQAQELLHAVLKHTKRATGGFENGVPTSMPLESNPHMHLFESTLAGCEVASEASLWKPLADEIAEFALAHFFDHNGVLHEFFDEHWKFAEGVKGRIVEPGHQYEWAWLLLRWAGGKQHPKARAAALKLIEVTEANGIREGLALQQVLDDFSPHDASARLWPQTERLKAAALAARLTGEPKYFAMAASAAEAVQRYLATPIPGLWYDRIDVNGKIVDEPAPASTFYHLVVAVAEISALARLA